MLSQCLSAIFIVISGYFFSLVCQYIPESVVIRIGAKKYTARRWPIPITALALTILVQCTIVDIQLMLVGWIIQRILYRDWFTIS